MSYTQNGNPHFPLHRQAKFSNALRHQTRREASRCSACGGEQRTWRHAGTRIQDSRVRGPPRRVARVHVSGYARTSPSMQTSASSSSSSSCPMNFNVSFVRLRMCGAPLFFFFEYPCGLETTAWWNFRVGRLLMSWHFLVRLMSWDLSWASEIGIVQRKWQWLTLWRRYFTLEMQILSCKGNITANLPFNVSYHSEPSHPSPNATQTRPLKI